MVDEIQNDAIRRTDIADVFLRLIINERKFHKVKITRSVLLFS
jgi:hypothetical protein